MAPDSPALTISYEGPAVRACADGLESSRLFTAMEARASQEIRYGHDLSGPQRDDLNIQFGDHAIGRFGSAGEKRRAALILKLAVTELLMEEDVSSPILLLDDIDSEFDDERLRRILDFVKDRCQTFISTSKQDVARRFSDQSFLMTVETGCIGSVEAARS